MRNIRRRLGLEEGISLVEVVVATAVLAVVITATGAPVAIAAVTPASPTISSPARGGSSRLPARSTPTVKNS